MSPPKVSSLKTSSLKTSLALAVLASAGLTGAARAQNLAVSEATTGKYLYTYSITPAFNTTLLTFSFTDPSVVASSASGPLGMVTMTTAGNFVEYSLTGSTLMSGSTETVAFSSPDAPGSFVNITSNGTGGSRSAGPAAVPEASTTVSFGLLLVLGLGGLMVAAKKRRSGQAA